MNCKVCGHTLDPMYGPNIQEVHPDFPHKTIERKGPVVGYMCRKVLADGTVCGRRYDVQGNYSRR